MSASSDDKASVIPAGYQQVLGNQYVMASERLEGPESLLKRGNLSVRKLVCQVAKSGLYRKCFFESSNPYRFIELNFEHLLGHAPQNTAEMLHHFTILQEQGYDAEIDSYSTASSIRIVSVKRMWPISMAGTTPWVSRVCSSPTCCNWPAVPAPPSRATSSRTSPA